MRQVTAFLLACTAAVAPCAVTLTLSASPLQRTPAGGLEPRPGGWEGLVWCGTDCNASLSVNANLNTALETEGEHAGKLALKARVQSWTVSPVGSAGPLATVSLPVTPNVEPDNGQDAESANFRFSSTNLRSGTGGAVRRQRVDTNSNCVPRYS